MYNMRVTYNTCNNLKTLKYYKKRAASVFGLFLKTLKLTPTMLKILENGLVYLSI
jgi:hypothetical protein